MQTSRQVTAMRIDMMPHFVLALAALAVLMPAATAHAADSSASAPSGYVLPDTEVWELASEAGNTYRIFVSRPGGEPPEDGYPVLYVLDGNAIFASFHEARRLQESGSPEIGRSIIVGIGYPTDLPYDVRRLYDFTAPLPPVPPPAQARLANHPHGGQDRFLAFLLDRLRPEVARRYEVNPHRQALFGHSLGGLFALHVLYTRPQAFSAIIAASPSQWWNDQGILTEERAFARRLTQGEITIPISRLLLLAGEDEEYVVNLRDTEALARRLQPLSAYGLRSHYEELADETHASSLSRAVTTALRFAFSWR